MTPSDSTSLNPALEALEAAIADDGRAFDSPQHERTGEMPSHAVYVGPIFTNLHGERIYSVVVEWEKPRTRDYVQGSDMLAVHAFADAFLSWLVTNGTDVGGFLVHWPTFDGVEVRAGDMSAYAQITVPLCMGDYPRGT